MRHGTAWAMVAVLGTLLSPSALRAQSGPVADPQLMTDHPWWPGELSCSTFERLFKTQAALYERVTGRKVDNDEDKALASWYWRNTHFFHSMQAPEPGVLRLGNNPAVQTRDYWRGLFSYGHALCTDNHHQYSAEMEYLLGPGRGLVAFVQGHTSHEAWLTGGNYGAGKWVLLDSDISTVCFDPEKKKLLNISELSQGDRKVLLQNRTPESNRGWLPELCSGDGQNSYAQIQGYSPHTGYALNPPVIRLRPGETLRRYPRPGLGNGDTKESQDLLFIGPSFDNMIGPNRHIAWVTAPQDFFKAGKRRILESSPEKRGRFGNAIFTYAPDFAGTGYREGLVSEDAQSVTLEHDSPFVIVGKIPNPTGEDDAYLKQVCTRGLVLAGKAACKVSVSTDNGRTWSGAVDFKDGLDLTDLVKGRYAYQLRFLAPAKDLAKKDLSITTACMANGYVMPHLKGNGSQVTFNAGGETAVTYGPQAATIQGLVTAGALSSKTFTVKLKTPRGERIRRIHWSTLNGSSNPPPPDLAYRAEVSKDGQNWKPLLENFKIVPPVPYTPRDAWSQSFFYGSGAVAEDAGSEVLLRISNNGGKEYYAAFFALSYESKNTGRTRVTFCWDEAGAEKKAEHLYPAGARMDASWNVPTGLEPKLKWVEMKAD